MVSNLDTGTDAWQTQDSPNPVGDGINFGRDYRSGRLWKLDFAVGSKDTATALAVRGDLHRAWMKDDRIPGAMQTLRYSIGGRTRLVYGRPRDFTPETTRSLAAGVALASGEFQTADPWHYDDELRSLQLNIVTASRGGVVLPTTWPLMTESGGERQGVISDVGGDAPAPFIVTFNGPITDPYVRVSGREVKLLTTLAYDQAATVDTRLMTARRNDGANLAGALSRKTRLAEARISPGPAEVVFGGADSSGTATATVQWRPTYYGF
ncbi:hypothetical protein ACSYDW_01365 [Paeniglutamicibacter sp. R2-26]|uniref:hypothetical protein n=1 Tax=Paeniglutamicibacter sp. R2-26 TaxID=3144417 RepID=UPI003EE64606